MYFYTKGFTDFLPEFTQIYKQTFTRINDIIIRNRNNLFFQQNQLQNPKRKKTRKEKKKKKRRRVTRKKQSCKYGMKTKIKFKFITATYYAYFIIK